MQVRRYEERVILDLNEALIAEQAFCLPWKPERVLEIVPEGGSEMQFW